MKVKKNGNDKKSSKWYLLRRHWGAQQQDAVKLLFLVLCLCVCRPEEGGCKGDDKQAGKEGAPKNDFVVNMCQLKGTKDYPKQKCL